MLKTGHLCFKPCCVFVVKTYIIILSFYFTKFPTEDGPSKLTCGILPPQLKFVAFNLSTSPKNVPGHCCSAVNVSVLTGWRNGEDAVEGRQEDGSSSGLEENPAGPPSHGRTPPAACNQSPGASGPGETVTIL